MDEKQYFILVNKLKAIDTKLGIIIANMTPTPIKLIQGDLPVKQHDSTQFIKGTGVVKTAEEISKDRAL